jgi:hypothetical protein
MDMAKLLDNGVVLALGAVAAIEGIAWWQSRRGSPAPSDLVAHNWDAPEFQDVVAVLAPHVQKIQAWLSRNTQVRKWNADGPIPMSSLYGNGAVVRFSGQDETLGGGRGWWDVEVSVVGGDVRVKALPPQMRYPGWVGHSLVASGKVADLGDLDRLLGDAGAPLELILSHRWRR